MPFDRATRDTAESAGLVNAADEAWKAGAAERVDASRVEAWRRILAEDDLRLAEACLGDRLRAYGYPSAAPEPPRYVEVHSPGLLGNDPEVAADVAARGARFWGLPGERPGLAVFLGDPNHWLGHDRRTRYVRTARLAGTILRHRLAGMPMDYRVHSSNVSKAAAYREKADRELVQIAREARRRRKLPEPDDPPRGPEALGPPAADDTPLDERTKWAWWALGAGHVASARKHARWVLSRAPLAPQSWKLTYCTLRGY